MFRFTAHLKRKEEREGERGRVEGSMRRREGQFGDEKEGRNGEGGGGREGEGSVMEERGRQGRKDRE